MKKEVLTEGQEYGLAIFTTIKQTAEEKGINEQALFEAVSVAYQKAYEQTYNNGQPAENVKVEIDYDNKMVEIVRRREIVDQVEPGKECEQISLADAAKDVDGAEVGYLIRETISPSTFSRIAIDKARSVITQRIREEERRSETDYFNENLGKVVTGTIDHINSSGNATVRLGKATVVLKANEMLPGDSMAVGKRVKVYIKDIIEVADRKNDKYGKSGNAKKKMVIISRTDPGMVKALFETEIPEIADGTVGIYSVGRDAGVRSKVAVYSNDPNVDPLGTCIGEGRSRIDAIVNELGGEKIDIIVYDEIPAYFIENSISPAKVVAVSADPDTKKALVVVPDDQLSLAIGLKGLNVKLAVKLTGYTIDIKSETQANEEGLFASVENGTEEMTEEITEEPLTEE